MKIAPRCNASLAALLSCRQVELFNNRAKRTRTLLRRTFTILVNIIKETGFSQVWSWGSSANLCLSLFGRYTSLGRLGEFQWE